MREGSERERPPSDRVVQVERGRWPRADRAGARPLRLTIRGPGRRSRGRRGGRGDGRRGPHRRLAPGARDGHRSDALARRLSPSAPGHYRSGAASARRADRPAHRVRERGDHRACRATPPTSRRRRQGQAGRAGKPLESGMNVWGLSGEPSPGHSSHERPVFRSHRGLAERRRRVPSSGTRVASSGGRAQATSGAARMP